MAKKKKNWIKGAIKNPGGLRKALNVPMGKPIPAIKLAQALHSNNAKVKKMAVLAETLKKLHK